MQKVTGDTQCPAAVAHCGFNAAKRSICVPGQRRDEAPWALSRAQPAPTQEMGQALPQASSEHRAGTDRQKNVPSFCEAVPPGSSR